MDSAVDAAVFAGQNGVTERLLMVGVDRLNGGQFCGMTRLDQLNRVGKFIVFSKGGEVVRVGDAG